MQHMTFFASGGSNVISSGDLRSAYGVGSYSVMQGAFDVCEQLGRPCLVGVQEGRVVSL